MPSELFPRRLETERLRLEPLTVETVDVLAFYRLCSAAESIGEVTEHLQWDPHDTPRESLAFVRDVTEKRENDDGAEYLVVPNAGEAGTDADVGRGVLATPADDDEAATRAETAGSGAPEVAGVTGLTVDWDRRVATLGLWLRKPFWGRGYSGERAAALLSVAFDRLDLDAVTVEHYAGNENSRRAIEKYVERFGGGHDGLLRNWAVVDGEPVDSHRYSVTAEQYRATTR